MFIALLKANIALIYNLQHAALPQLDECTSFFGVFDGHGGTYILKSVPVLLNIVLSLQSRRTCTQCGLILSHPTFRVLVSSTLYNLVQSVIRNGVSFLSF